MCRAPGGCGRRPWRGGPLALAARGGGRHRASGADGRLHGGAAPRGLPPPRGAEPAHLAVLPQSHTGSGAQGAVTVGQAAAAVGGWAGSPPGGGGGPPLASGASTRTSAVGRARRRPHRRHPAGCGGRSWPLRRGEPGGVARPAWGPGPVLGSSGARSAMRGRLGAGVLSGRAGLASRRCGRRLANSRISLASRRLL